VSESLRILQVSYSDRGGGAHLSAYNLMRAYRARGHASWLAVGKRETVDPDVFEIENDGARTAWARWWARRSTLPRPLIGRIRGAGRFSRAWASASLAVGEPRRYIDRTLGREDFRHLGTWKLLELPPVPPDVVHCHNLHGDYFDLRALPWLSASAPVVLDVRDLWLTTGHCAHPVDCGRWRTGCGSCPDLDTYPQVRRDSTAFNWRRKRDLYAASRLYVTAPSQWTVDRVRRSILTAAAYRVVPNGIDLETFRPGDRGHARRALGLAEDAFVVLFVAHSEYRDLPTMEAALAQLVGHGRELRFVCLGAADDSTRRLGDGTLTSVPFVFDQGRVALYYQAANVYLHAAHAETFGRSVAEALACASPVVATAVGGIPEIVRDGETGFLTAAGDAEALAQRMQLLLDDNDMRTRLAAEAARDAVARFGLDRQADAFLDWYREVADDWRGRSLASHEVAAMVRRG